ncbi:unnamed protein product [Rotaria sordida]|uniref:Uncharacterized protein n=1 Tax=Rotaria sordida TaxID=392033 RepID=A0A815FCR6_9BILA|nr:unnamed protein product [Rotaria sordida]
MWGTINEKTRIDLKKASQIGASDEACKRQIRDDVQEDKETLDPHHTHSILFDSGNLNEYLSDSQRSSFVQYVCDDKNSHACYAVTIVVEGGLKTPQVVQFDIDNGRPVVIIHGSGLGLPAPFCIEYQQKQDRIMPEANIEFKLSKKGINYYIEKELPKKRFTSVGLIDRWIYFHTSPMVKMGYHFFFYIWIILALDLEIWYLQSLKFIIAIKSLGPKIFMLKNMLQDLFAFLYIIFVAIAAYGVVSRSLFMYNEVSFDGKGIFGDIFYPTYWFMYDLITSGSSTVVAGATATHVLLAFHMLFINILLLNLLIAVFSDTIGIENDHRKKDDARNASSVFKMIAENGSMLDEHWDMFENAATYSYARSSIEEKNKSNGEIDSFGKKTSLSKESAKIMKENMESIGTERQPETNTDLKEEIKFMRSTMIEMQIQLNQKNVFVENLRTNMDLQSKQVNASLSWIMDAIERVKMHGDRNPRPDKNATN